MLMMYLAFLPSPYWGLHSFIVFFFFSLSSDRFLGGEEGWDWDGGRWKSRIKT